MPSTLLRHTRLFGAAALLLSAGCRPNPGNTAAAATVPDSAAQVARGQYLADFGGCNDCHTPLTMTPNGPAPDMSRMLSGQPANAPVPPVPVTALGPTKWGAVVSNTMTAWAGPWGVSFTANLTPSGTGLKNWTAEQFVQTMRTGKHLGVGRNLLPPMPWRSLGALTDQDLHAIFAYLRTIPPVDNQVPPPVPPAGPPPPPAGRS